MKTNYWKLWQHPAPFIILEDFNYHNTIWIQTRKERVWNLLWITIYSFITKSPTYICPFSGSYSVIDLSLCDPSVFMDISWKVLMDTYGGDHFPIRLQNSEQSDETPKRWNLSKANWEEFQMFRGTKRRTQYQELNTVHIVQSAGAV